MPFLLLQKFARSSLSLILIAAGFLFLLWLLPPQQAIDNLSGSSSRWATPLLIQPAAAQRIRVGELWRQVYQQMPDLPLENQYVSRETGDVSSDNTLIGRLIRYHVYIKGRPTTYRLDWKLTLADYLGANERILPETYPSGDTLRTNPIEADRAAIQTLTRAQRDELVQVLVSLFNPNAARSESSTEPARPNASPTPSPSPSPVAPSSRSTPLPQQPQPGDAQLLAP